jgi:Leucine-rich repeat (LRR) protein
MKKLLLVLLALPFIGFGQNVNIPDANFKAYLVGEPSINTNGDTEIQVSEATVFNGAINCSNKEISNLTGIEAFTALTQLECYDNQLTSLDVSANTALTSFNCYNNQLTSLDVSANTSLTILYCNSNQLTRLDVSANTALTVLGCSTNQLSSLNLSTNTALTGLWCWDNQFDCDSLKRKYKLE